MNEAPPLRRQRGRSGRRRQEPKTISTVGGAYPNLSFSDEEDRCVTGVA